MSDVFLPTPRFDGFENQFHVMYDTPDGRRAYVLTGTLLMNFHAVDQDWTRGSILFSVDLPGLPPGMGLRLSHWAPLVTLAAITNDSTATNAAWTVDRFDLQAPFRARPKVNVTANLAVRDSDGFILRLSYCVHLLGTIVPDEGPEI
jgi:hypothetical protein